MQKKNLSLLDKQLLFPALIESVKKLNPLNQAKNPVMFVVYIGSIMTTLLALYSATGHDAGGSTSFIINVTIWLWITFAIC